MAAVAEGGLASVIDALRQVAEPQVAPAGQGYTPSLPIERCVP